MKRIAVCFGGRSNEREISCITGMMVCNVCKQKGYEVLALYQTEEGKFMALDEGYSLSNFLSHAKKEVAFSTGGVWLSGRRRPKFFQKIDCVIICFHGGVGEGGGMAGLCELLGLPYVGCGVLGSSLALDKGRCKKLLRAEKIPCLARAKRGQFPVVVKPTHLGSSIGVCVVHEGSELEEAIELCLSLDDGYLVEPYLEDCRELNCAVYEVQGERVASPVEEVVKSGELLSFDDKYEGGAKSIFPAQLPKEVEERVQSLSLRAYEVLQLSGIVRFDFLWKEQKLYLSEVNTTPGSLAYRLVAKNLSNFGELLEKLVEDAISRYAENMKKMCITTEILSNIPKNACKIGIK